VAVENNFEIGKAGEVAADFIGNNMMNIPNSIMRKHRFLDLFFCT